MMMMGDLGRKRGSTHKRRRTTIKKERKEFKEITEKGRLIQKEKTQVGGIKLKDYCRILAYGGLWLAFIMLIFYILSQVGRLAQTQRKLGI